MFKELKGLGVVVKELSSELRQMVKKPVSLSAACLPLIGFVMCLMLRSPVVRPNHFILDGQNSELLHPDHLTA